MSLRRLRRRFTRLISPDQRLTWVTPPQAKQKRPEMAAAKTKAAPGLGDGEDVELVPDNCAASCVTCGQDPTSTNWPIASSLSCLVGAGCVVLPPDDMDDETLLRKRSDGTTAAVARPVSREAAPTR